MYKDYVLSQKTKNSYKILNCYERIYFTTQTNIRKEEYFVIYSSRRHTAERSIMRPLQIYRKRFIPAECILLKDDIILEQNDEYILTKWNTLNPKTTFSHGCSCYFLQKGIKVSKFYRPDNTLLYWYCDIVDFTYDAPDNILTVTDLLADVIVYPDGSVQVVDLDEMAEALETGLISSEQMCTGLRNLNHLLSLIYAKQFGQLQDYINRAE